jgi:hypothetical protein
MAIVNPRKKSIATMGFDWQIDLGSELIIPRDSKEELVHIKDANQLLDTSIFLLSRAGSGLTLG